MVYKYYLFALLLSIPGVGRAAEVASGDVASTPAQEKVNYPVRNVVLTLTCPRTLESLGVAYLIQDRNNDSIFMAYQNNAGEKQTLVIHDECIIRSYDSDEMESSWKAIQQQCDKDGIKINSCDRRGGILRSMIADVFNGDAPVIFVPGCKAVRGQRQGFSECASTMIFNKVFEEKKA